MCMNHIFSSSFLSQQQQNMRMECDSEKIVVKDDDGKENDGNSISCTNGETIFVYSIDHSLYLSDIIFMVLFLLSCFRCWSSLSMQFPSFVRCRNIFKTSILVMLKPLRHSIWNWNTLLLGKEWQNILKMDGRTPPATAFDNEFRWMKIQQS